MLVYLVVFGLPSCSNSWRTQFKKRKPYFDPEAKDMTPKAHLQLIYSDRLIIVLVVNTKKYVHMSGQGSSSTRRQRKGHSRKGTDNEQSRCIIDRYITHCQPYLFSSIITSRQWCQKRRQVLYCIQGGASPCGPTPACGFAHACNSRGCRQIVAVNATILVLPRNAIRIFHG